MSEHDDNVRDTERQLASYVEDLRAYVEGANRGSDMWDEGPNDDLGPVGEFGLSWEHESTNWRRGDDTWTLVLATGGPHYEFQVTYDQDTRRVDRWVFVALPWFDRVEIPSSDQRVSPEDESLVAEFFDMFYDYDTLTTGGEWA